MSLLRFMAENRTFWKNGPHFWAWSQGVRQIDSTQDAPAQAQTPDRAVPQGLHFEGAGPRARVEQAQPQCYACPAGPAGPGGASSARA